MTIDMAINTVSKKNYRRNSTALNFTVVFLNRNDRSRAVTLEQGYCGYILIKSTLLITVFD